MTDPTPLPDVPRWDETWHDDYYDGMGVMRSGRYVLHDDHAQAMLNAALTHEREWLEGTAKARDTALREALAAVEALGQTHPKWDLMSTHYEGCWKNHSECALTLALAAIQRLIDRGGQR